MSLYVLKDTKSKFFKLDGQRLKEGEPIELTADQVVAFGDVFESVELVKAKASLLAAQAEAVAEAEAVKAAAAAKVEAEAAKNAAATLEAEKAKLAETKPAK